LFQRSDAAFERFGEYCRGVAKTSTLDARWATETDDSPKRRSKRRRRRFALFLSDASNAVKSS
jgi:hypothetical protein